MSCLFSCCASKPTNEPSRIGPQAQDLKEYNSFCDRAKQALGGCGLSTVSIITGLVGTAFTLAGGVGIAVTYSAFAAGLISTGFIGLGITLAILIIAVAFLILTKHVCGCARDYVVKTNEQITYEQQMQAVRDNANRINAEVNSTL